MNINLAFLLSILVAAVGYIIGKFIDAHFQFKRQQILRDEQSHSFLLIKAELDELKELQNEQIREIKAKINGFKPGFQ